MPTDDRATQTTPQGREIPVPNVADVLRDLRKVAKAPERPSDTRPDLSGPEDK